MKDWTGQTYDEVALADAGSGRADYDANLIRHLDPRVSLHISGPTGGERLAARCRTGFVLLSNATCELCGAVEDEQCRSSDAGTAGHTLGNEPKPSPVDPDILQIMTMLQARRP